MNNSSSNIQSHTRSNSQSPTKRLATAFPTFHTSSPPRSTPEVPKKRFASTLDSSYDSSHGYLKALEICQIFTKNPTNFRAKTLLHDIPRAFFENIRIHFRYADITPELCLQ